MDIKSFFIAIGSIILTGINIYITYRARNIFLRQMLYAKQLEGFSELIGALYSFYNATKSFIYKCGGKLNDETRPELRRVTKKEANNLSNKQGKWAVFLPGAMSERINNYIGLFNGISAHPTQVQQYPENIVYADDPGGLLWDELNELFTIAIKYLGTEYISKETLKMLKRKI